jgi:hypothetical protein
MWFTVLDWRERNGGDNHPSVFGWSDATGKTGSVKRQKKKICISLSVWAGCGDSHLMCSRAFFSSPFAFWRHPSMFLFFPFPVHPCDAFAISALLLAAKESCSAPSSGG